MKTTVYLIQFGKYVIKLQNNNYKQTNNHFTIKSVIESNKWSSEMLEVTAPPIFYNNWPINVVNPGNQSMLQNLTNQYTS